MEKTEQAHQYWEEPLLTLLTSLQLNRTESFQPTIAKKYTIFSHKNTLSHISRLPKDLLYALLPDMPCKVQQSLQWEEMDRSWETFADKADFPITGHFSYCTHVGKEEEDMKEQLQFIAHIKGFCIIRVL